MATKTAKATRETTGPQKGGKLIDSEMKAQKRLPRLQTKMLIDNKWVDAAQGTTFATLNPATGEKICDVAEAHVEDVNRAVHAAKKAFPVWSSKTGTIPVHRY